MQPNASPALPVCRILHLPAWRGVARCFLLCKGQAIAMPRSERWEINVVPTTVLRVPPGPFKGRRRQPVLRLLQLYCRRIFCASIIEVLRRNKLASSFLMDRVAQTKCSSNRPSWQHGKGDIAISPAALPHPGIAAQHLPSGGAARSLCHCHWI